MGLVFSIYSFASVAASPMLGRLVQLGYVRRVTLLLSGLLVVSDLSKNGVQLQCLYLHDNTASLHNTSECWACHVPTLL